MSTIIPWHNNNSLFPITIPPSPQSSLHSSSTSLSNSPLLPPSPMFDKSHLLHQQQLCIPTHQLFDFPEVLSPPSSPGITHNPQLSITINPSNHQPIALKRPSSSVDQGVAKKPRGAGERISAKDFVPPDVSGLSKREARLVKNRAAAFLSRQRKREEFESMEIRVAELEQENARLIAITQNRSTSPNSSPQPVDDETIAENERLRTQLAAAHERELELCAQLRKASLSSPRDIAATIKPEPVEPHFSLPACQSSTTAATRSIQSPPHKSPASFGLMVLLCALPTLLSMNTQSSFPTSYSLASPNPSSSPLDFKSLILSHSNNNECTSLMDLEGSDPNHLSSSSLSPTTKRRKLEFMDGALAGLNALDISFETSSAEDGKIRVRIHSPGSSTSETAIASSPTYTSSSTPTAYDSLASPIHGPASPTSILSHSMMSRADGDPFLGAGATNMSAFGGLGSLGMSWYDDCSYSALDLGSLKPSSWISPITSSSSFSSPSSTSLDDATLDWIASTRKQRVKIALKGLPAIGEEGGEWEVQVC